MPDTTSPGRCPNCSEPLDCEPDGHHCTECGFHDDQPCDREFNPDLVKFPDMPATIVLPPNVFDTILAVYRRRDSFRWAALCATEDTDTARRLLELAAVHAAGSTRLTPATAYWLALYATSCGMNDVVDPNAEPAYWTVRNLIPTEQLAELDVQREAEYAIADAEYAAWKAAQ